MIIERSFLFFLLFIAFSCSTPGNGVEQESLRPIIEDESVLNIKSIISDFEVVELKGAPLIGSIKSVMYTGGKYYVVDASLDNIKVFDKDFNYASTIDHLGYGPGQYHKIDYSFIYSTSLYVFSNYNQAIFEYDLNGTFINKRALADYPFTVLNLENKVVSYTNFNPASNNKYNLELRDLNGKVNKRAQPFDLSLNALVGYSGGISKSVFNSSSFYYQPPLSDTIFKYDDNLTISEVLILKDLIKRPFPGGIYSERFHVGTRNEYGFLAGVYPEMGRYMLISYKDPPALKNGIIDLHTYTYYPWKNIESRYLFYMINAPQFSTSDGFVYALPSIIVSSMMASTEDGTELDDFLNERGVKKSKLAEEDFHYLFKFKIRQ